MVAVTTRCSSDEARPEGRLQLGTVLSETSLKIGLTNADVEALESTLSRPKRR